MARRLVAAGHTVRVYDIRPEAVTALSDAGASPAQSPAEASHGAAHVITMLPDTPQVEEALDGREGILRALGSDATFIDMSTISPVVTRRLAKAVEAIGAHALDAPVSGGVSGAQNGRLSIMVGGPLAAFEGAKAIFEVLGTTVTHVGGSGAGQAAKLCNQVVVAMNIQAICEGFSLGAGFGLDLETLRSVLAGGSAGSWMMDNLAPKIIAGDASAGFRIDLQLKDLRLALEASQAEGIPLPGASLVTSLYLEARAHGEGSNGNQALYRTYQRLTSGRLGARAK
jgi:2-hydroxy-3-oxopropionate reductase